MPILEDRLLKTCSGCTEQKPLDAFYKQTKAKDGRQHICKLCRRDYNAKNWRKYHDPEKHKKNVALYHERHADKIAAQDAVRLAIKTNRLVKAGACEDCEEILPAKKLDGHHEDYEKPLEVVWLCRGCHLKRHHKEFV